MPIFHGENGLFGQPKVQEAYNIINFRFLMENSILEIFGSVDVKITPDFCHVLNLFFSLAAENNKRENE